MSEAQPPAEAAAKPKKRRVLLTPTRLAAAPAGQLDCRPTVELSAATSVSLNLPLAKTEVVNGSDQFCLLLQREAESALQTHEQWARSPHAAWIQELSAELDSEGRVALLAKQRLLQGAAVEDFAARWEAGSELAGFAIRLWFAGKSLEQVMAKSASLGHTQLRAGVVLSGRFVSEVAAAQDVATEQLLPWVSRLTRGSDASLYRVEPSNAFATHDDSRCPLDQLPAVLASGAPVGSLNTTHEYDDEAAASDVPMLDEYYGALDGALYAADAAAVRLNPRFYLIWK